MFNVEMNMFKVEMFKKQCIESRANSLSYASQCYLSCIQPDTGLFVTNFCFKVSINLNCTEFGVALIFLQLSVRTH